MPESQSTRMIKTVLNLINCWTWLDFINLDLSAVSTAISFSYFWFYNICVLGNQSHFYNAFDFLLSWTKYSFLRRQCSLVVIFCCLFLSSTLSLDRTLSTVPSQQPFVSVSPFTPLCIVQYHTCPFQCLGVEVDGRKASKLC